mmetsp:Transcript_45861/g.139027  ORF Transcript_45861/g.139027 Transcript_45861/m.139027 type:complete len:200 (-) Transcript_45861:60-659(-)|eukprot:CAMPEP_0198544722 /NCGR_PEP_ID=MMETSP1462-20131121/61697_1 /TAXON_ID=1333877 /ORGANISM="Brandtodinium nutriculum, Strain RCC3387" /LENGTH=199 /DNA_ID=CAMNT_0044275065 /DNA_START=109 /DNA_END=708 /DNA_ORIENTATION=-
MLQSVRSWLRSVFDFLGLFPRDARICFLGLDNAGKTTLLQMLKENRQSVSKPTLHPSSEEVMVGNVRFRTTDLGGHETARRIWRNYYANVGGVVFIVDAADRTRFAEAREELHRLLAEPALQGMPVVVLGNKIDILVAASEDELRHQLGLPRHMTAETEAPVQASDKGCAGPTVAVFMCSIVRRMGYAEALTWMSKRCV